jgi:hypothetical protein
MKIFFCLFAWLPSVALAELFDCVEYGRKIQQSYPCDSILMRPKPLIQPRLRVQSLPALSNFNQGAPAQPANNLKLSDEQLLWLKAITTH